MTLDGRRIGSIRVEARLGAGGMGEVWRGFDEKLERWVALKTVPRTAHGDAELKAPFLREARLLSKLGHPGICRIHDLLETDDGDFLVLELVEGETLRELAIRGVLRAGLVRIGIELATALAAAHGAQVIHRDLKPENVMVTPSGAIKILDFGIARTADLLPAATPSAPGERTPADASGDDTTERIAQPVARDDVRTPPPDGGYRTEHGTVLGTRRYMSPEQAAGTDVSTATDVYALGVMLEELLAHAVDALPVPDASRHDADADLSALLASMLAHDPQRRPSAAHVAEQLRAVADKPRRVARRRLLRRLSIAAALGLVAIAVAMAWLAWTATQARQDAERRRRQAEALVDFMLGDLRRKLEGVGRIELLDDINTRALAYFDAVPPERLSSKELEARIKHLQHMADVAIQGGKPAAAEAPAVQSLALAKALLERSPDDARWQKQYAEALNWLGYVRWELGRPADDVLVPFREGLAISAAVARAHPDDVDQARALAASYNNVGAAELSLGTPAAAVELLEKAAATRRAYLPRATAGERSQDRAELAGTLGWLSSAQETAGRLGDSLATRREQVGMLSALSHEEPDNSVWRADLSVALRYQSDLEHAAGDVDAREASLRAGLAVAARLAAHDPDNAGWRRSHGVFLSVLGAHLADLGRLDEARELQRAALAAFDALLAKDPDSVEWPRYRALAALRLALADALAGAPDATNRSSIALATLERLRESADAGERNDAAYADAVLMHARVLRLAYREDAARDALDRAARALARHVGATRDWQTLAVAARVALARGEAADAGALSIRLAALGARAIDAARVCAQPGYACSTTTTIAP